MRNRIIVILTAIALSLGLASAASARPMLTGYVSTGPVHVLFTRSSQCLTALAPEVNHQVWSEPCTTVKTKNGKTVVSPLQNWVAVSILGSLTMYLKAWPWLFLAGVSYPYGSDGVTLYDCGEQPGVRQGLILYGGTGLAAYNQIKSLDNGRRVTTDGGIGRAHWDRRPNLLKRIFGKPTYQQFGFEWVPYAAD